MKTRRKKRTYSVEFKEKMVKLYNSGKSRAELIREFDLTPSALGKWISYYNNSGSFKCGDNISAEEKELIELRKQLKQLEMENDILKQAALIMAQKKK